ncbi:MAG: ribose-phosphate pyrophosphokinase-like domain-containing protein, partial [Actinomycetota bacterium]|nr:ribose-phosphate pyrophosphokinase-like domain-containing protein [Actinomycetota bacterium]
MKPTIFAGSANVTLAEAIAAELDIRPGSREVQVFPDGEMQVELQESVRGEDVYLLQPTSPPGEKHLLELLL